MAENAQSLPAVVSSGIKEFNGMPAGRQLALMGMAAGAIVVVVALLYWSMRPTYVPLFPRMEAEDAAEVVQVLSQAGIQYQVDSTTGQVKVPQGDVASARLQLASEGLPRSGDLGFELLQEDTGLGTSRMIEGARRHRAMEGELARTVASLDAVDRARVHIAEGEQSVFVRDRRPASASVVVHLRGGRSLSEAQVGAIVHLVASSTSDLDPEQVTVVDQRGRLLTQDGAEVGMGGSSDRLGFTRDVEQRYTERVQDLLIPIVGRDRVRVQVNADIDFSQVERTEELYDPETIALRSEQTRDEERTGPDAGAGGVPGALTNQPPAGGVVGEAEADNENGVRQSGSRSSSVTRNFEVDRRINHIREMPGGVQRVSTAVVVDFRQDVNEDGESVQVARDAEELDRIESLVREAVGFDAARGDTINVVTAPFEAPVEEVVTEEIALWEQSWFLELVKIVAALLLALVILLTVVRPAMKQLLQRPEPPPGHDEEREALTDASGGAGAGAAASAPTEASAVPSLTGPKGPDQQEMDLEAVREMVREDPKRVAQVMKTWLGEDGR